MRVMFDTNTLDRMAQPERFKHEPSYPLYNRVHRVLAEGSWQGYFSETLITLEGIQKAHRAKVLGSTELRIHGPHRREVVGGESIVNMRFVGEMDREPLHPLTLESVHAALNVRMICLRGPARVAWPRVGDPDQILFEYRDDDPVFLACSARTTEAAIEIETRGLGHARLRDVAKDFAARDNVDEFWYTSLVVSPDVV